MLLNFDTRYLLSFIKKILAFIRHKNCLRSALVAFYTLKFCSKKPMLCIGVNIKVNSFSSHAWIEVDNLIFQTNDQPLDEYKKILEI